MKLKSALCFCMALICSFEVSRAEEPLKVGAVFALSGGLAFMGQDMHDGMMLCSKSPDSIIYEDHQTQATTGLSAFTKLAEKDGISFGIVSFSNVASAVIPVAHAKKIPLMLTIVSSKDVVRRGGDSVVNFFTTSEQDGSIMGKTLAGSLKFSRAAVLFLEGEFGQAYADAFAKAFTDSGGIISYKESYLKDTDDFRTQLLRLKSTQPEVLYVIGFDNHVPAIWRQAKQINLQARLASNWTLSAPQLRERNKDIYEGAFFTSPVFYLSESGIAGEFKSRFAARYGRPASAYAGLGCDMAGLIDKYGNKSAANFLTSLKNLKGFPGVMGEISYGGDGQIGFPLYPVELKDGELRRLDAGNFQTPR